MSYCTFRQNGQDIQPLLWVRFPKFNPAKEKTYKFALKMTDEESVLCKAVHVKFLDTEKLPYDDDEKYDGLGIAYIRLKGVMIDQSNFNFVSE